MNKIRSSTSPDKQDPTDNDSNDPEAIIIQNNRKIADNNAKIKELNKGLTPHNQTLEAAELLTTLLNGKDHRQAASGDNKIKKSFPLINDLQGSGVRAKVYYSDQPTKDSIINEIIRIKGEAEDAKNYIENQISLLEKEIDELGIENEIKNKELN